MTKTTRTMHEDGRPTAETLIAIRQTTNLAVADDSYHAHVRGHACALDPVSATWHHHMACEWAEIANILRGRGA